MTCVSQTDLVIGACAEWVYCIPHGSARSVWKYHPLETDFYHCLLEIEVCKFQRVVIGVFYCEHVACTSLPESLSRICKFQLETLVSPLELVTSTFQVELVVWVFLLRLMACQLLVETEVCVLQVETEVGLLQLETVVCHSVQVCA